MNRKLMGIALVFVASPMVTGGCDSRVKSCNEFFDVAAPILSAVAIPTPAPSGSAAIAWARNSARHYERLAEEAGRIAERESDKSVRAALEDEQKSAVRIATQLDALADAATSVEPAKIPSMSSLSSAAKSERDAASSLEEHCTN